MNKFEPKTGGHPLRLDEFKLMQDAYFDGFNALIRKFAPSGNAILDGFIVDTTGANIVFTSGHISINGEVFYIPSGSFSSNVGAPTTNLYVMPIIVSPDDGVAGTGDPAVYEDTTSHNVHIIRNAVLKYYDSGTDTGGVLYSDFSYPGAVLEGSIIPWAPPSNKNVSDYFDTSGLGINSAIGYAICNGNNNTLDLRGMFLAMATDGFTNTNPLNTLLGGVTVSLGTEIGNNTTSIQKANLPNYALPLTVSDPGHTHNLIYSEYSQRGSANSSFGSVSGIKPDQVPPSGTTATKTGVTEKSYSNLSISGTLGGSGSVLENRPPTHYIYYITRVK